jgi:pimeloyl-ACP methyl ester carboxylesterase
VLPGTGHFLMMQAPQRFNPVLLHEIAALAKA